MVKYIQYGLRRSGTNWFAGLIKTNFGIKLENISNDYNSILHKHYVIGSTQETKDCHKLQDFDSKVISLTKDKNTVYFVHIKHPYSWYLSMKKWCKKCKTECNIRKQLERYNNFYSSWIKYHKESSDRKIKFIKYNTLLKSFKVILNDIEKKYKLKKKYPKYENVNSVPQSSRFNKERRQYYLSGNYQKYLSAKERNTIKSIISEDILNFFQYTLK